MDVILFFLGIIFFLAVVRYVSGTTGNAMSQPKRCNELRQPHKWREHIQPGFENEERQPIYLKCDKCGWVYGTE
jgi:hypothetical protein